MVAYRETARPPSFEEFMRGGRAAVSDEEARKYSRDAKVLQELLEHPGWKIMLEYLDNKMRSLSQGVVCQPASGLDDCLRQEFDKGTIVGLSYAAGLPAAMMHKAGANSGEARDADSEDE